MAEMRPMKGSVPNQLAMGAAGGYTTTPLSVSGFALPPAVQWAGGTWEIIGDDSQVLVTILKQNEELITEPGSLLSSGGYFEPTIVMGGMGAGCKRSCCAGESCFRVAYKNNLPAEQTVTLTPSYPAKIIPLDMAQHPGGVNLTRAAWMSSFGRQHEFDLAQAPSCLAACCGGQGCFYTTLKGPGMTFVNAGGTALKRTLAPGEVVVVDTMALVAWESTVQIDVQTVGGFMMMCCGGSGCFNTKLTGPGLIIVASMSGDRMRTAYMPYTQQGGGGGGGDGGGGGGGGGG